MITVEEVIKSYRPDSGVLNGVTFSVKKGEFVFLVGESGSGKSALLKLLYAEEKFNAGHILVNGVSLGSIKPRQIPKLRRQLGLVFEDLKLFPDRTVAENVAYPLHVQGMAPKQVAEEVADFAQAKVEELLRAVATAAAENGSRL